MAQISGTITRAGQGLNGTVRASGRGIASVDIDNDGYLVITYTDGEVWTSDEVIIGNGIESIDLTSTSGAVKTYTITFTDGTTTTFNVTDGEVTNASLALITGDLTDLETTDKTSIVSAVNEVNGKAEDADEHVGDLSELETEDKTSAVNAINEVNAHADQNTSDIAELKEDLNNKVETVYETLGEEFGENIKTLDDEIIYTFSENEKKLITSIASQNTVTYFGKNIFDQSTKEAGKIKNDSDIEVNDSFSCYFSRYIPCKGKVIKPNFKIQRIYRFNANKTLIERTSYNSENAYTVPSDTYYIQIQVENAYITNSMAIWFGEDTPTYAIYQESNDYNEIDGETNAVYDGKTAFSLTVKELGSLDDVIKESAFDTIKDVFGMFTFSETNYVITLGADIVNKISSINSESELTFFSKNIFDQSTKVAGKIKNDSGVEVSDGGSCYYSQYIPCHGKLIKANFVMQRLYLFDSSKTFLRRTSASGTQTGATIPDDTYFIQIQIDKNNATDSMCIWFGDDTPTYSPYKTSSELSDFDDGVNIINTGAEQVTVNVEIINTGTDEGHIIPAVSAYNMWEPETVTDDYKCTPLGQFSQSIPALTSLGWPGFLETYFDIYLGSYSDGYEVFREDLGLDSGAQATGNIASPVYSYTFQPKYYNKTVLLSAGMNTCEASTYFGLAYFIKALMEHTEDGMLALYNSTRFIVMPVICPSGIAHDPLLYPNSNGVRINKNFEYYGSWSRLHTTTSGDYPDSEVETKILKYWLNKYRGATFWLDCHSDTDTHAIMKHLGTVFCSDSETATKLTANKQSIIDFYVNKGYISASDTISLGFYSHSAQTAEYPKTQYAKEVCDTPAAMMEQFEYSTAYGSNGNTSNDTYAIKHYVAMIRYMVLIMCRSDAEVID